MKKYRFVVAFLAIGGVFLAEAHYNPVAQVLLRIFIPLYLVAHPVPFDSTPRPADAVKSADQTPLAPAAIPFAEGLSIQSSTTATLFARQANGGYIGFQFQPTPPNTLLNPMSDVTQWLSGGLRHLMASPPGPSGTGTQSLPFALSVINSDGSQMLAVAASNLVAVSRSASAIPLTTVNYPVGPDVNSVFFADFNGDGNPDLAVAFDGSSSIPGGIAILLNTGGGNFASPVLYGTTAPATQFSNGGTPATRFAVFDLNHDGFLDIATASLGGTVSVFLGKGDGTFGAPTPYTVGGSGEAIAIADVNGDGVPDIVAGGTTGILLGNGDGTFHAGAPLPPDASGALLWAFAAGDLNGDGKVDIVYADTENQVVVPLFGNGDGTFRVGQAYAVSQLPDSLILADYNNDGRLDIINGQGDARIFGPADNSGNTEILLNNGDETFQGVPAYFALPNSEAASSFTYVGGMAVANFGGATPGVLASGINGTLSLFQGDGKGGLKTPRAIPLPGRVGAIAVGDFNGDGLPDAAVLGGSSGLAILRGTAGGFATPTTFSIVGTAIASGDFDGDGKVDLAVAGSGSLTILKGNGDGTFQTASTVTGGPAPVSLSAVDLNGDGNPDLVIADNGNNGFGGAVYVAINQGGGVFQTPVNVFSGLYPGFGIGDVNGDGKLDLVVSGQNGSGGNQVSWLAGNGNGTFQAPISISSNSDVFINTIVVKDFNGDGNADLVLPHQYGVTTFLAGNGDGTFSAETPFLTTGAPIFAQTADLNGDGKPDLIVGGLTITPLLNVTTANFPCQLSSTVLQPSGAGGNITVTINSGSCALGVTNLPSWITVASTNASSVTLTIAANTGGARSANISIGSVSVTVNQAAPPACSYSLNASGEAFTAAGGNGAVGISVNSGCPWNATSPPSWITFTSGASGSGAATFTFQASANSGAARSGTFTVAGISFNVQQQAASIPGLNFIGSMAHLAAEENWTTTFTLVNKSASPATARLSFSGDALDPTGNGPLTLPVGFPQQAGAAGPLLGASFDQALAGNASLIVTTSGPPSPPVLVGSAQLAATGAVDGFAIFHQIVTTQEAVVPMETRNASSYLLAFDNTNGLVLGVAVENVSAQAAVIPVIIRDDTGAVISAPGTSISLGGNGHTSFVLSDPALGFPVTANKRGTIEFDTPAGGQISVLGLRFTPPNNALTTIPALANVGTGGGSIAHLASGGDGWQTTFVLVNTGTSSAQATLSFFNDQTGTPLSLPLTFPQGNIADTTAPSLTQPLAAGATLVIVSGGAPQLLTGSAQLSTTGHVSGFVIFRHNGQEAVVPLESRNANGYIIAFDNTNGTATGVAVNAVSAQAVNIPVTVRDDTGATIATDTIAMNANGHYAFTLGAGRYPGALTIRGTIEFDTPASAQIGALGIRIPTGAAHTYTTLPALSK
jgi:hypothetical protein